MRNNIHFRLCCCGKNNAWPHGYFWKWEDGDWYVLYWEVISVAMAEKLLEEMDFRGQEETLRREISASSLRRVATTHAADISYALEQINHKKRIEREDDQRRVRNTKIFARLQLRSA